MTDVQQWRRLLAAVDQAERSYAVAKSVAAQRGASTPVRHKCFVSFHTPDIDAVTEFVETYNDVFIPRVIGVSDSDQFKDPVTSEDEEYIKSQIGAKYLSDSTVTILYVGRCAWARKYIDWELSSSLRNDPVNKRNGLLAITPADRSTNSLPSRFADNFTSDDSKYARYYYYPTGAASLRSWIEDAFQAREGRHQLIDNTRALRTYNSTC